MAGILQTMAMVFMSAGTVFAMFMAAAAAVAVVFMIMFIGMRCTHDVASYQLNNCSYVYYNALYMACQWVHYVFFNDF